MNKLTLFLSAIAVSAATPAYAAETIAVPFTTPDGGVSTGMYSGVVKITVSGTGFSNSTNINDAFYQVPSGALEGGYYQLAFGTTTLLGSNPAQDAKNFIVGAIPAYNASHVYTFLLNTGVTTATALHFGVSDDVFGDNGGAYSVMIAAVPEPATWALMLAGFGMIGFAARRRNFVKPTVTYA